VRHVVLLVSPRLGWTRALARALELARQAQATLVAVAVVPESDIEELARTLTDVAFVGEKLSADVAEHVRQEQETLAQEMLRHIEEEGRAHGVAVVTEIARTELHDAAESALARYAPECFVVAVPKRPWHEKLWGRTRAIDWPEDFAGTLETVEEEGS